jgi:rsbT co-antagonist protein RsbR
MPSAAGAGFHDIVGSAVMIAAVPYRLGHEEWRMGETARSGDATEITELRRRIAELSEALAASEQREKALRQSEQRFRLMHEGSDDGGWDWDLATGESYLSPSWYRLVGCEVGELPGNVDSWIRLVHPDDAPRVNQALEDYFAGRRATYEIEYRILHKSGKWRWIVSRGKVVRDESGKPMRMTGTLTDITRRRDAEDELRRSQSLLNALIDHSPTIIHIRDLEGRFVLVNNNHAAFVNLERAQILGKTAQEVFSPEVAESFRKSDSVVLETGQPVAEEETVRIDRELRTFLSIRFPLNDDSGGLAGLGGISTDITERKRAEEERAALQARVIEAQRLALRELSTPLIPITDDAVVMPLIGAIDSQRAQQLMEVLLDGVAAHRADTVIIDVTGVQVVDTEVAEALVRASRAVKLLGAEVVLTGIRPEVAQTLVEMDVDLGDIVVHGSLRNGIAYALARPAGARSRQWAQPGNRAGARR